MTATKYTLTQTEVKRLFHYEPATGVLTRRISVAPSARAGAVAGCAKTDADGKSYLSVCIKYKHYRVHRIIWMYIHGEFPKEIDHINGCGTDNRLANLRSVTPLENSRNRRLVAHSTSGTCGVTFHVQCNKWQAQIKVQGKSIYLGIYENKSDAVEARKSSENEIGFHDNHGQIREL